MDHVRITLAAGAIIDVMTSSNFDWRSRLEDSDFLESADWLTACEYARATFSAECEDAETASLKENIRSEVAFYRSRGQSFSASQTPEAGEVVAWRRFEADDNETAGYVLYSHAIDGGEPLYAHPPATPEPSQVDKLREALCPECKRKLTIHGGGDGASCDNGCEMHFDEEYLAALSNLATPSAATGEES